jgi:hypothetical protein
MRPIFMHSAVALIVGLAGAVFTSACFESATIGEELCTGTNPGCCATLCGQTAPAATCEDGAWTCADGDSLGPNCPGVCMEPDGGSSHDSGTCVETPVLGEACSAPACNPGSPNCGGQEWVCADGHWTQISNKVCAEDGGAPGTCSGANPGCCTTDCSVTPPEATCTGGAWTCPTGDTLGPVCPTICAVDGGAPTSCEGANPGCCSTDCSVTPPEATCQAGKWTCPGGDTLGPVCPTICAVDGGPPSTCAGSNPGCCSTDCTKPAPQATCSDGAWTCPAGDTLGPICDGLCMVDGGPGMGGSCSEPEPNCCLAPPLCETLSAAPTCSDGTWTCPTGATVTHGACACGVEVDGGSGATPG